MKKYIVLQMVSDDDYCIRDFDIRYEAEIYATLHHNDGKETTIVAEVLEVKE